MEMGTGEIKRQYKYAKNRKKCIAILAELNCCSADEIKAILGLRDASGRKAVQSGRTRLSTEEINSLCEKLDELDAQIKPLENEYKRTVQMLLRHDTTGD